MNTRGLPYSEEAEKALLGAVILDPNRLYDALEQKITPEDFYFPSHQTIFRAMQKAHQLHLPIDPVQLLNVIKTNGELDRIGSSVGLVSLAEDCYSARNASSYAKTIRDKATLRNLQQVLRRLSEEACESLDAESFIQNVQSTFINALPERHRQDETVLADAMHEYLQRVETLGATAKDLGLKTGFRDLDALTKGFRKGQLIILAGRPGMGKSALSTSIVLNQMKMAKDPSIAIFSLEMTDDEIAERTFSGMARINGDVLKSGNLQAKHWANLTNVYQVAARSRKVSVCSAPSITTSEIRAKCQKKLIKDKSLDLVIIDYLQLVTSHSKRSERSREQEVAEISRDLKNLAKELKVPVIALSQLNRESENRDGNRPKMSDLRYSGSLEQDADIICLIYRDEFYNSKTTEPGIAEITIAKQRNGKTGMFKLAWNSKFTLFENYSSNDEQV